MKSSFYEYLDYYIPNPKCELNYSTDYELLIATVLSAQCTDKRVNEVTKILFKYNLEEISLMSIDDIEKIIRSCGSYTKKAVYVKNIADILLHDYNGKVPNSREILETFPGVGPKTCSVVLKSIYNVPAIPVDTHVERVSKRLKLAFLNDTPYQVEMKLKKLFPQERYIKSHHQFIHFGRYFCKAINPSCSSCKLKAYCRYKKEKE